MPSSKPAALRPLALFLPDGTLDRAALATERGRRAWLFYTGEKEPYFREYLLVHCRADPAFFVDQLVFGYDPRRLKSLPFVLWPRQREYLEALHRAATTGEELVVEKSRDVGVTYLTCAYAVWRWLFSPGFKTTFCANKLMLVDSRGNPDSIFEKLRLIIRLMPVWLRPKGFSWELHDNIAKLTNPENGNVITGEGGDNAGRGGRSTLYVIDEAAHVERADSVNTATSANSFCRVWASSVNGVGNFFYRHRHSGEVPVFTFGWRSDPRKNDDWAAKEKARIGPVAFAQEHDLDYGASLESVCIPKAWVDAARELRRRLGNRVRPVRPVAGMDVGAGKAESVVVLRSGPLVHEPLARRDPDSVDTAWWAIEACQKAGASRLCYDSVGVGHGLGGIFARAETPDLAIAGVNVGDPPSDMLWPDERTSKDKFANLKAELWWRAREAFERSHALLRHLDGDPEGVDHPLEDVLLMPEDEEIGRQLATPKWLRTERGKIILESKDSLARRGVKSPDRAEAFILSLHEGSVTSFYIA